MANETEKNGLVPMTYVEAAEMHKQVRRQFSFLAAPYMVRKTVVIERGQLLAAPPQTHPAHLSAKGAR